MTVLALTFAAPLLLLGLLAVGIPLVLHLLEKSRAQEMLFPTLRFLRISMDKTARRRRVRHLLLMALRMVLLGLLALAVAEPISQALGGWLSGRSFACVLIVDNSLSMSAAPGQAPSPGGPSGPADAAALATRHRTRLDKARAEAKALLSDADRPSLAAVWTTNGPAGDAALSSRLDVLREQADRVAPSFGKAALAARVSAALTALAKESAPQKAVALFSDLQKVSFDDLLAANDLARAGDVHLLIVNTAGAMANNVSVADVKVEGRPIVNQLQVVSAEIQNSSPVERAVPVGLRVEGQEVGQKVRLALSAAPADGPPDAARAAGSVQTAKFNWWPREVGTVTGEVVIEEDDDLPQDNVRRFVVEIAGQIRALIVRGPPADPRQPASDPAWTVRLALNPFADAAPRGASRPADRTPGGAAWFLSTETLDADQFSADSLGVAGVLPAPAAAISAAESGADPAGAADGMPSSPARQTPATPARPEIVFLCDVPKLSAEQAAALEEFVSAGGTVVIFVGPNVDAANYAETLGRSAGPEGSLLPAPLGAPVGEVGPTAGAVFLKWVDLEHPYFQGLYKDLADVREDIRGFVQRRYSLGKVASPAAELVRLENDEPLIVTRPYGAGRVVLCTTSAAPGWSNLPATSLFPPMLIRMSLLARRGTAAPVSYLPGSQVAIRPRGLAASAGAGDANSLAIAITLPADQGGRSRAVVVPAVRTGEGATATFAETLAAGVYSWRAAVSSPAGEEPLDTGAFAVNPPSEESDLQAFTPEQVRQALAARGFQRTYVGNSYAEARAAALDAAQKRNWWDVLAAAAIVALVAEALVANRGRGPAEAGIPAHLNPRLSSGAGG